MPCHASAVSTFCVHALLCYRRRRHSTPHCDRLRKTLGAKAVLAAATAQEEEPSAMPAAATARHAHKSDEEDKEQQQLEEEEHARRPNKHNLEQSGDKEGDQSPAARRHRLDTNTGESPTTQAPQEQQQQEDDDRGRQGSSLERHGSHAKPDAERPSHERHNEEPGQQHGKEGGDDSDIDNPKLHNSHTRRGFDAEEQMPELDTHQQQRKRDEPAHHDKHHRRDHHSERQATEPEPIEEHHHQREQEPEPDHEPHSHREAEEAEFEEGHPTRNGGRHLRSMSRRPPVTTPPLGPLSAV